MKVLSLCSGVGGAELALEQSDIDAEVIGYAEIDKFASSIYEKHFPNHKNLGDLTKIKAEELEDFDMLISWKNENSPGGVILPGFCYERTSL